MSTRAIFTFTDNSGTFHVYKHWDCYPTESGAIGAIRRAMRFAWDLPRFEADEFAAAFVAANKRSSGDVRLVQNISDAGDWWAYRYEISLRDSDDCFPAMLHIKMYDRDCLIDEVWLEPETV